MASVIKFDQIAIVGEWTWSLLNSSFGTSLLGAGAGAVAGAWAAQVISDRRTAVTRQVEEIRSTNAAIAANIFVVNAYAAMKRQHIAPMKEGYDKAAKKAHALQKKAAKGTLPAGTTFRYTVDLGTLDAPHTPIPELRKLLSENISATPRVLGVYYLLEQSVKHLDESLRQRNSFIEWARSGGPKTPQGKAEIYFGLRQQNGNTDNRYPDLVRAISLQTDDCIAFGIALAEDLIEHGQSLAAVKRKGMPKAATCNFEPLKKLGLLPPAADYEDVLAKVRGQQLTPSSAAKTP